MYKMNMENCCVLVSCLHTLDLNYVIFVVTYNKSDTLRVIAVPPYA